MQARDTLTVRFPAGILATARQVKGKGESLNELVVDAVKRELQRRQAARAYDAIVRMRESIRQRTGVQPDSTDLVRELRAGTVRDD